MEGKKEEGIRIFPIGGGIAGATSPKLTTMGIRMTSPMGEGYLLDERLRTTLIELEP